MNLDKKEILTCMTEASITECRSIIFNLRAFLDLPESGIDQGSKLYDSVVSIKKDAQLLGIKLEKLKLLIELEARKEEGRLLRNVLNDDDDCDNPLMSI